MGSRPGGRGICDGRVDDRGLGLGLGPRRARHDENVLPLAAIAHGALEQKRRCVGVRDYRESRAPIKIGKMREGQTVATSLARSVDREGEEGRADPLVLVVWVHAHAPKDQAAVFRADTRGGDEVTTELCDEHHIVIRDCG